MALSLTRRNAIAAGLAGATLPALTVKPAGPRTQAGPCGWF